MFIIFYLRNFILFFNVTFSCMTTRLYNLLFSLFMYYFNRMSKRSVLWSSFLLSLLHWLYCIVVVRVITQYNSVCDSLQSGSWHTDFFCSYLNQTIGLPYSLLWYLIGGQGDSHLARVDRSQREPMKRPSEGN